MVLATKTTRAMAVSTRTLPTPNSLITPAAPMPARTGLRKFRFRFSAEARRQAMRGPTPMRKRRAMKIGIFTRLKKGAPTLTLTPRTASESSGKTVPKKTVKVAAIRKRLFRRKTDSRETAESSSPWARSRSVRHARSEKAPSRARARKARKKTPMDPCVKEWTEPMMPERVRNVPNSVRLKVRMIRVRFQSLSMRRRYWIITECRKAVPVSQGMKAALVGRDGRQALEGRRGDAHDEEEEGEDTQHDREDPGVELGLAAAIPDNHDQRIDREHPRPEHDGALERAPERGDAVVEGRAAVRVHGDVAHGEVEGQERVE